MNKRTWFWAGVALQVLILAGIVASHLVILSTGTSIVLLPAPLDPWDPLRGEYVRLEYGISRLSENEIPMAGLPYKDGQALWVTMRQAHDGSHWVPVAASGVRPAVGDGEVALRGSVRWAFKSGPGNEGWTVYARYGVEQLFVPEGEARKIEQQLSDLSVELKVDRWGRAAIYRVFIGATPLTWR